MVNLPVEELNDRVFGTRSEFSLIIAELMGGAMQTSLTFFYLIVYSCGFFSCA